MTKVTICGIYNLKSTLESAKPDVVISITDPGDESSTNEALKGFQGKVLRLSLHDIDKIVGEFTAPNMTHGRKLKNFLDEECACGIEHVLVHCHMGISRSPAFAIMTLAILATREQAPSHDLAQEIVSNVFQAAPMATPNKRVLAVAERIVRGFNGAIIDAAAACEKAAEADLPKGQLIW